MVNGRATIENQELAKYRKEVQRKIDKLIRILSPLTVGEFDKKIPVPKVDDEFAEIQVGIKLMLEVIQEKIAEYERLNAELEQRVRERTAELQVANSKNEAILSSIGDGAFAIDLEGRIMFFNPMAENISGFSQGEALGGHYTNVIRLRQEKTGEANYTFIDTALSGTPAVMENHTVLIRKDGVRVPVADSAAPIREDNGELLGAIVVFRDVSKERKFEQAKDEFVSLVSHQLRTPLTSMRLFSSMLSDGRMGGLSSSQQDAINKIQSSTEQMIALVGDVLNISRIELGQLKDEPIQTSVNELIRHRLDEVQPLAKERRVKLIFTPPPKPLNVLIDPNLLGQVVHNLLTNAIRYTPEGSGVVKVKFVRGKNGYELSVADNGIGVPAHVHSSIFERFYRADNAVQQVSEGTGLGLYLVKMIVDHIGGDIRFTSKENEGTTFYVHIPLR